MGGTEGDGPLGDRVSCLGAEIRACLADAHASWTARLACHRAPGRRLRHAAQALSLPNRRALRRQALDRPGDALERALERRHGDEGQAATWLFNQYNLAGCTV